MIKLQSYKDISKIKDNFTYTSPPKKSKYIWTLFFGFLTGDLNPVHINFFTYIDYKSRLGKLSRHGISSVAQAESFIFKIFSFVEPTEILSKGYNKIRYIKPVNIGDILSYQYTLLSNNIIENKEYAECIFEINAFNQKNEKVFIAEWIVLYCAIEKKIEKTTYVVPLSGIVFEAESVPSEYIKYNFYYLLFWSLLFCSFLMVVYFKK